MAASVHQKLELHTGHVLFWRKRGEVVVRVFAPDFLEVLQFDLAGPVILDHTQAAVVNFVVGRLAVLEDR